MKKIVLTFGLLSGLVSAVLMFITVLFIDQIGWDKGVIVGYTGIVLSLLFVFFGVRSYRDNHLGGKITFGKAFGVGLLITLVSCLFYVIAWEIEYATLFSDFTDKYAAFAMEQARASGADAAAMAAKAAEMDDMRKVMDNPIVRPLFIFIEPFPVGLLVTLISAAVLRKK
jgi:hypothetical protein